MNARRQNLGLLIAGVILVLAAACNGDDSGDDVTIITDPPRSTSSTSSTTTSSTTTTVDPLVAAEAEVKATYEGFYAHYFDIFGNPDPENPLIEQYLTGPSLQRALDAISEYLADGTSAQPPEDAEDFELRVLRVDVVEDEATVLACAVDGSLLVRNETGEVLNDVLATNLYESTLLYSDRWRISETRQIERREGRWSCDR